MSAIHTSPVPPVTEAPSDEPALRLMARLLRNLPVGAQLRMSNGHTHAVGAGEPAFTLVLNDPALPGLLVAQPHPARLAEAYFGGAIDIEGDLYAALALRRHFETLAPGWRERLSMLPDIWRLRGTVRAAAASPMSGPVRTSLAERLRRLMPSFERPHSQESDRRAIAFHYDVSNAFYRLWLDPELVYSCAYFESAEDTLAQAQQQKLAHICRKLRLKPAERLLDIGCGWGALICWAARHHGVRAHGITLSPAQFAYTRRRIDDEGLRDLVSVELLDYRDLRGAALYDKVASIGMYEHVGLDKLPAYLATVARVLRPGGLFLNHGMAHDEEGWNPSVATEFINRHIFPHGEFDCVSKLQLGLEHAGFEIEDVESLRRHYALTLRHWVRRLEAAHDAVLDEVGERTWRVWRLYMAACALEFEAGGTGVYQILATRRGAACELPLTRSDLYAAGDAQASR